MVVDCRLVSAGEFLEHAFGKVVSFGKGFAGWKVESWHRFGKGREMGSEADLVLKFFNGGLDELVTREVLDDTEVESETKEAFHVARGRVGMPREIVKGEFRRMV